MRSSWLTHALALAAGGVIAGAAWAVLTARERPDASGGATTAGKAERPDSVAALRRRRNAKLLDERIARLQRISRIADAAPTEELSLRRELQREQIAEREAETAKLLEASRHWQGVKDLSQPLSDAALARDDEAVMAIFLEWARRDPEAAFRELERRSTTWDMIDGAALAALPDGVFLAELRQADRLSRDFFYSMGPAYGVLLGQRGDLDALWKVREVCPNSQLRDYITAEFLDSWLPEDSAAAARQMVAALQAVTPELRHDLFAQLADSHETPNCCTEEFMKTLLAPDWQADNTLKERLSGGPYSRMSCFPATDIDLTKESSKKGAAERLKYWEDHGNSVAQEPDWAELYADRRMSPDESG